MAAPKAMVAQGYDRSAYLYDDLVGASYLAGIRNLLMRFPAQPGALILDVGTGTGIALLEALRQAGPTSLGVGVDISPNMVQRASAKAASLGLPARFLTADAEHLPFADGTFDLVICSSAFHWFTNRLAAAREMYRTLKPGGRLLLVAASAPCGWEWFTAMAAAAQQITGRADAINAPQMPSSQEIVATVAAAGFQLAHAAAPVRQSHVNADQVTLLMSLVVPNWSSKMDSATAMRVAELGNRILASRYENGVPYTSATTEVVGVRPAYGAAPPLSF